MCLVAEITSRSLCPEPPSGHCPGSWHNSASRPASGEPRLEKDKAAVALSSWPAAVTQVCAQPCLPCLPRPALRVHRACVSTPLADKDHAACQGLTWDLLIRASVLPFPMKGPVPGRREFMGNDGHPALWRQASGHRVPGSSLWVGVTVAMTELSLLRALIIERLPAQETGDQETTVSDELCPLSLLAQTGQEKSLLRAPCLELQAGHQQDCSDKIPFTKPGGGTNSPTCVVGRPLP